MAIMRDAPEGGEPVRRYLVASDFDQTLSFNDSGATLAQILGVSGFEQRVAGLAETNLVHQGAELAYLIRHDPQFRSVRRAHLIDAGRRVRLKRDIPALVDFLKQGVEGFQFEFYVISAAPREVIQAALEGIVAADHVYGTVLDHDPATGEIRSIQHVPAGYGKVAVLEALEARLGIPPDRTIYVGDGSSDVHVMLHTNNRDGFTVAVSENRHIAGIAKRTVLSDSAFSIVVPILEDIVGWDRTRIRAVVQAYGLEFHDWTRSRTDWVTLRHAVDADDALRAEAS